MSETTQTTTTVEQVDIDLNDILGIPGAESIMLPEDKKPNVFSKGTVDTTFIDKPDNSDNSDDSGSNTDKTSFSDVLKDVDPIDPSLQNPNDDPDNDAKKTPGRSKIAKDGTVELVKKLIDAGKIVPFDDDKPIEEYTLNDFEELLEANFEEREKTIRQSTPVEFFQSLPEELQVAAKYVAYGGQDLK